jgi:hypothetical protein
MFGELWPEHEGVVFCESDDLHRRINRSHIPGHQVKLRNHALCMFHLDFNPRNIIMDGNRICTVE